MARRIVLLLTGIWMMLTVVGCSTTGGKIGRVVATPIVAVRDVVDVPLVSLSSVFNMWGDRVDPFQPPTPGISWTFGRGLDFGIAYGLGYFVFKGLTGVIGGVDYVACRSLYPAWPVGLRPWKKKNQKWSDLYFPGLRALWGDHPPDTIWDKPKGDEKKQQKKNPESAAPADANTN
jgi:hypothetical protein